MANGIHILGHGDEIALGSPLADLVGETVIDVDVKPNRGDALSMVGLAREIAAFTGSSLRLPEATVAETDDDVTGHVSVRIEEPDLNPRFTARWFEDVANGPSPDWMQRRLIAAGMRPISAVVDVTNYVMHELGQPMHAYDADAIPGGEIVVRRARPGERLVTIDHVERELDEKMLVIADRERPIGLAGIMGGASTEVGEGTTRVILESAIFHGPTIRNTARRLGLRSEASMRHEKGIGHDLPRYAVDRAARLIAEITGARVARGIVDNDPEPKPPRRVAVDVPRMRRLLGIELDAGRVRELLEPLGFGVSGEGDQLEVEVPSHRLDVVVAADVAEEVARAYGYERIDGRLPQAALPPYRPDPSEPRHVVRRILAGLGLDEMIGHALIGPEDLERVRAGPSRPGARAGVQPAQPAALDPASVDDALRPRRPRRERPPPSARRVALRPRQGLPPSRPSRRPATAPRRRPEPVDTNPGSSASRWPGAPLPHRPARSRSSRMWPRSRGSWTPSTTGSARRVPTYAAEPEGERHPHRHPGRTALILDAAGRPYGSLGEVHPRVVEAWGLTGRPVDAAIDLGRLLGLGADVVRAAPIPSAQPVDRDLAVVVTDETPVGEVLRIARTAAGPRLVEVRLFDVYRGGQVGTGRVSYALAFRFQPLEAGEEKEVDRALNKVRGSLQHHLGAEIR